MAIYGGCRTTAMGIMPHTDIERALELALGLDIPFWPQLPNVSFYEDMYVQSSQNFPGITVDIENKRIMFDNAGFEAGLDDYSQAISEPETFTLSREYSSVYHRFLAQNLEGYQAIRGQITGPVSFGFKVVDEGLKPIIYNEDVRGILFDFIRRKINIQYRELSQKNRNAFVWVDEPGLGWVFSSLSGYSDVRARDDYLDFIRGIESPSALHLCANVNLPFLLGLGIDILSFDAYQIENMPGEYARAIARFLDNGGILCWGIVPTDSSSLGRETPESLCALITSYWESVSKHSGLAPQRIAEQALLAPARCCLKNVGQVGAAGEIPRRGEEDCQVSSIEEQLVEKAFSYLQEMSEMLRRKYGL